MNTSAGQTSVTVPTRKSSNQNIQVYARVRPLNGRERSIRSSEVIDVISPREIVTRHSVDSKLTKKFTFDRSFGPDSRQVEVYSTVVAPLIEEVLSGYNCTVFAYGQTGTGKTHTMVGTECAELKSSWEDDSDIGIIPRALSHLFDELRLMEMEFSMRISYLELYNEELCDLLASEDSTKIRIFDDSTKKGSVIIQGLEEIPVHSKDDVYKLLEKGKERRKTATTLMNAQSSRSHTVFSILVHIRENGIDGEEMLKIGKLNLVDLAGSENVSKAGNEKGIRVRETVNINQSLLTLGRVITALVERTPHIPYRESKLTRLLQESLGGRTKTSIIATISPGHKDIEETLSTLEYAHRAKNIQNKPEVNQKLTKKTVLKEYTEEIDKLKRDLMAARDKNGIYLAEETYNKMTLQMDSQNRELNEKVLLLKALKEELQNKEKIFNEVSLNLVEKTEELQRTEQNLNQTKGALQQTKKVLNTTKRRYKEKKVLLQSHLKTEEELTNQATQILEVANIATNDTQQLHKTIERRKDVDQQIQTACERFTERMHDNFELMDENLSNFQEQHKSYSQLIMDEFTNSTNVQNKLLSESNQKIKKVNELCVESLTTTSELIERFGKIIDNLSEEHKVSLEKLFEEQKQNELKLRNEIQMNLSELEKNNGEQKSSIDAIRGGVAQMLQTYTSELDDHTTHMQQQIMTIEQITESDIQQLALMRKALDNERSIASQEQSIIDEFVDRMQTIKQQRKVCADSLNSLTGQLEHSNQKSTVQLRQNSEYAQTFCKKRRADNIISEELLDKQSKAAMLHVDESIARCSTLQIQFNNLGQENIKQVDAFKRAEKLHFANSQAIITEQVTEVKRMRLENEKQLTKACAAIGTGLAEDTQRLKGQTAVAIEFSTIMQKHVNDYAQVYKKQMGHCATDIAAFKKNELQTYAPTGTTPSKRNFMYPRTLAATSPHNQIVTRFRQENDWSDLDTTATIDEGSEDEELNSMQDLSTTETILNSTPIDAPPAEKCASFNGKNSNFLKPHLRSSSLTLKKSPQKNSPVFLKKNKENLS